MASQSDPAITTHAECSFDPALYSSMYYSAKGAAKVYNWLIGQFHDIFIDGMNYCTLLKP